LSRLVVGIVAIAACARIDTPSTQIAPVNACPAHVCTAYAPYEPGLAQAQCTQGVCTIAASLDYVLVVTLPETSFFAPTMTFAITSDKLFSRSTVQDCTPNGTPESPVPCARLPDVGVVSGQYLAFPSAQSDVGFALGNGPAVTAIPTNVTYRPLWTSGTTSMDATSIGIPLLPVRVGPAVAQSDTPGPSGGPSVAFQGTVPPGTYERTIAAQPPFDSAFPPDVHVVTVAEGAGAFELDRLKDPDTTSEQLLMMSGRDYPKFNFSRADGKAMDGSRAYLRDQTTKRIISSTVVLGPANETTQSPPTYHVQLNTNHAPTPSGDALENAELVVEPNAAVPAVPTYVGTKIPLLPPNEPYPSIADAAIVSGTVTSSVDESPVVADLVFLSTQIFVTNNPSATFSTNLSYVGRVSTDDQGAYTIPLPRGTYDVVITPHAAGLAQATRSLALDPMLSTQAGKHFEVDPPIRVHGTALVADGRPLVGADVEANPAAAGQPSGADPARRPRSTSTITAADGTFTLLVDPGNYDVSVRPAEGTALPWFVSASRDFEGAQASDAGTSSSNETSLEVFNVPAPISTGLVLKDPQSYPIVRAVVRAYALPAKGTAYVEIGRALTDDSGYFDMYLAGLPH
jgi:hypothetical protein